MAMGHLLLIVAKEVGAYLAHMIQPKRCAVCESEEIQPYPVDLPDQLGKWKLLLADKMVYCCSNGHSFLILPDESSRSETFL